MTVRRITELTRTQLRALAAAGGVGVLGIGAVEQHGEHLPMGTDTMLVDDVLDAALGTPGLTASATPWIRLPTVAFGHSPHHLFSAAVSLRPETVSAVLADVLGSLSVSGVRRAVVVNGHGGNDELVRLAVRSHTLTHGGAAAALSYWTVVADTGADDAAAEHADRTPGHAGWFETSMLLAARPELVGDERPYRAADPPALFEHPPYPTVTMERHGEWARVGGTTDDAGDASAVVGAALRRRRVAGLAAALTAFDRATDE